MDAKLFVPRAVNLAQNADISWMIGILFEQQTGQIKLLIVPDVG